MNFSRHEKIGFQFSGGRDSLAALYVVRPQWERMTVYHTDAGEQFPETVEVVTRVEQIVPHFVRIKGRLAETEKYGLPTDLLPTHCNTVLGLMHSGSKLRLIDRYECCFNSVMKPMHDRMKADGVTLVIRGQRDADYANPPLRSGDVNDGMEAFYPIQGWSDQEVMAYLKSIDVQPARFYDEGLSTSPECMTCSAWWDDKRGAYLAKHHPEQHRKYVGKLIDIHREVSRHMRELQCEIGIAER